MEIKTKLGIARISNEKCNKGEVEQIIKVLRKMFKKSQKKSIKATND